MKPILLAFIGLMKIMEKVKEYLQYAVKPWYKARDFIAGHPNVALIVLLAVAAAHLFH